MSATTLEQPEEFEKLFRQHYSNLCAYAHLFVRDPANAEDVVQEVFFKLWKSRLHVNFETSVKSYLFRAVRNGCLNVIEQKRVRDEYRSGEIQSAGQEPQTSFDQMVVNELEQKIRDAIDLLPPERRKIFVMSRYEGLKYREIADELNVSVKTVENQMYQALIFMRERLKDYLPLLIWLFFHQYNK